MKTIKLPYQIDSEGFAFLQNLRKQQSNVVRYAFNRFKDGLNEQEIRFKVKELNNLELLDSWYIQCGIREAQAIHVRNPDSKVVFGGKRIFKLRSENKISKDEFHKARLLPLTIQGEGPQNGNRKFKLDIDNETIHFRYKRNQHFELKLPKLRKNYRIELLRLQELSSTKTIAYSIKINDDSIFITYDEKKLSNMTIETDPNRVISIDMNPSELGYSVLEFNSEGEFRVIESGCFDVSKLTKKLGRSSCSKQQKYQNNKRLFETMEISKQLIELAKHYKCCKFVVEDLDMGNKNHKLGRNFNRLVNNVWNRNRLISNLNQRCNVYGIEFVSVQPQYSSFIGNLNHNNFPDPISAAIELARRGFVKYKRNQFYPKLIDIEVLRNRWKEASEWSYQNWKELFQIVKNSKLRYRVSKSDESVNLVFQKYSYKKMMSFYQFI